MWFFFDTDTNSPVLNNLCNSWNGEMGDEDGNHMPKRSTERSPTNHATTTFASLSFHGDEVAHVRANLTELVDLDEHVLHMRARFLPHDSNRAHPILAQWAVDETAFTNEERWEFFNPYDTDTWSFYVDWWFGWEEPPLYAVCTDGNRIYVGTHLVEDDMPVVWRYDSTLPMDAPRAWTLMMEPDSWEGFSARSCVYDGLVMHFFGSPSGVLDDVMVHTPEYGNAQVDPWAYDIDTMTMPDQGIAVVVDEFTYRVAAGDPGQWSTRRPTITRSAVGNVVQAATEEFPVYGVEPAPVSSLFTANPHLNSICYDGQYLYMTHNRLRSGAYQAATRVLRVPVETIAVEEAWEWVEMPDVLHNHDNVDFAACAFDGRYLLFTPAASTTFVRYDTQAGRINGTDAFFTRGAWAEYTVPMPEHAEADDEETMRWQAVALDGRYMYALPFGHSEAVRYDVAQPMDAPSAWTTFAPTGSVMQCGRALFDGRFVVAACDYDLVKFDTLDPQSTFRLMEREASAHGTGGTEAGPTLAVNLERVQLRATVFQHTLAERVGAYGGAGWHAVDGLFTHSSVTIVIDDVEFGAVPLHPGAVHYKPSALDLLIGQMSQATLDVGHHGMEGLLEYLVFSVFDLNMLNITTITVQWSQLQGGGTLVLDTNVPYIPTGVSLTLLFGDTPAAAVSLAATNQLTAVIPARAHPGRVTLCLSNGLLEHNLTTPFYYFDAPIAERMWPTSGHMLARENVTICGHHFEPMLDFPEDYLLCSADGLVVPARVYNSSCVVCTLPPLSSPQVWVDVSLNRGVDWMHVSQVFSAIRDHDETCLMSSWDTGHRINVAEEDGTSLTIQDGVVWDGDVRDLLDGDLCCVRDAAKAGTGTCGVRLTEGVAGTATVTLKLSVRSAVNEVVTSWRNPCTMGPRPFYEVYARDSTETTEWSLLTRRVTGPTGVTPEWPEVEPCRVINGFNAQVSTCVETFGFVLVDEVQLRLVLSDKADAHSELWLNDIALLGSTIDMAVAWKMTETLEEQNLYGGFGDRRIARVRLQSLDVAGRIMGNADREPRKVHVSLWSLTSTGQWIDRTHFLTTRTEHAVRQGEVTIVVSVNDLDARDPGRFAGRFSRLEFSSPGMDIVNLDFFVRNSEAVSLRCSGMLTNVKSRERVDLAKDREPIIVEVMDREFLPMMYNGTVTLHALGQSAGKLRGTLSQPLELPYAHADAVEAVFRNVWLEKPEQGPVSLFASIEGTSLTEGFLEVIVNPGPPSLLAMSPLEHMKYPTAFPSTTVLDIGPIALAVTDESGNPSSLDGDYSVEAVFVEVPHATTEHPTFFSTPKWNVVAGREVHVESLLFEPIIGTYTVRFQLFDVTGVVQPVDYTFDVLPGTGSALSVQFPVKDGQYFGADDAIVLPFFEIALLDTSGHSLSGWTDEVYTVHASVSSLCEDVPLLRGDVTKVLEHGSVGFDNLVLEHAWHPCVYPLAIQFSCVESASIRSAEHAFNIYAGELAVLGIRTDDTGDKPEYAADDVVELDAYHVVIKDRFQNLADGNVDLWGYHIEVVPPTNVTMQDGSSLSGYYDGTGWLVDTLILTQPRVGTYTFLFRVELPEGMRPPYANSALEWEYCVDDSSCFSFDHELHCLCNYCVPEPVMNSVPAACMNHTDTHVVTAAPPSASAGWLAPRALVEYETRLTLRVVPGPAHRMEFRRRPSLNTTNIGDLDQLPIIQVLDRLGNLVDDDYSITAEFHTPVTFPATQVPCFTVQVENGVARFPCFLFRGPRDTDVELSFRLHHMGTPLPTRVRALTHEIHVMDCASSVDHSLPSANSAADCTCRPGFFKQVDMCEPCLANTFKDVEGDDYVLCRPCPSYTNTQGRAGVAARSECVCDDGFLRDDSTLTCVACPEGGMCEAGTVRAADGYWHASNASASFHECFYEGACIEGGCREGYEGALCKACADGYTSFGKQCTKCLPPGANWFVTFLMFSLLIIILVVFVQRSKTRTSWIAITLKIFLTHCQQLWFLSSLDLQWTDATYVGFSITSSATLNMRIASVECALGWSTYARFVVYMAMPLVLFLCEVVFWKLYWVYKRFTTWQHNSVLIEKASHTKHMMILTILVTTFIVYPTSSLEIFRMLHCVDIDGTLYLLADTTIQCDSTRYKLWFVVAFLLFFVVNLGVPFIWYGLLYKYRKFIQGGVDKYVLMYGFLVDSYKDRAYFWEIIITFRKFLMLVFIVNVTNTLYATYLVQVLLLLSIWAELYYQPFLSQRHHKLETLSLCTVYVTTMAGLFFHEGRLTSAGSGFFTFLLLLLNLGVFVVFALFMFRNALKVMLQRNPQRFRSWWAKPLHYIARSRKRRSDQSVMDGDGNGDGETPRAAESEYGEDDASVRADNESLHDELIRVKPYSPPFSAAPPPMSYTSAAVMREMTPLTPTSDTSSDGAYHALRE